VFADLVRIERALAVRVVPTKYDFEPAAVRRGHIERPQKVFVHFNGATLIVIDGVEQVLQRRLIVKRVAHRYGAALVLAQPCDRVPKLVPLQDAVAVHVGLEEGERRFSTHIDGPRLARASDGRGDRARLSSLRGRHTNEISEEVSALVIETGFGASDFVRGGEHDNWAGRRT
jgi:hypothetical protein